MEPVASPTVSTPYEPLKMCMIGLIKEWDEKKLNTLFKEHGIECTKLEKRRYKTVGFVTFADVAQKKKNIPLISSIQGFKGRNLLVDNVTGKSKKAQGRRKREEFDQMGPDGKRRRVEPSSKKTAKDAVTPNWRVPYEDQLLAKQDAIVKALKNFRRRTRKDIAKAHGGSKAARNVDWDTFPRWLRPAGGFAGQLSYLTNVDNNNNNTKSSSTGSTNTSTNTSTIEVTATSAISVSAANNSTAAATSAADNITAASVPLLEKVGKTTHGLPCPVETIVGMPNDGELAKRGRYQYRNKCEFTVGNDATGALCLGFRVSSFGDTILVQAPTECNNIPTATKDLCTRFEEFLKSSKLPMYDVRTHVGVYRQLTVQHSGRTGDLRGMVQVKLEGVADEDWTQEIARLTSWCEEYNTTSPSSVSLSLSSSSSSSANSNANANAKGLTGMLIQRYDGPSMPLENDPAAVPSLVWGLPDLEEHLTVPDFLNDKETPTLRFLVSPGAFFQVNTPGCELLYSIVSRYARTKVEDLQIPTVLAMHELKQSSSTDKGDADVVMGNTERDSSTGNESDESDITLLDVCCGTGTIGLCVAASNESVKKVVGVELCNAAVSDAKRNAELNNQGATAHFFAAKAEAM